MAGCVEDVLIDLGEPAVEEPSYFSVSDSIEVLRDDSQVHAPQMFGSPTNSALLVSPVKDLLLDSPPLIPIDKEMFDFDLPLTPVTASDRSGSSEAGEDEEEVYFGPVGFKERCVATAITSAKKERKPLSPLNPRQFAEIFKEANAVACRISSAAGANKKKDIPKEKLQFARKQLRLDRSEGVPKLEVAGSLLKAISGSGSHEKVCDMVVEQSSCDIASVDDELLPLINIEGTGGVGAKTGSVSEGENPDTPTRQHMRSSTYTVDKTPIERLSPTKRRSLPVVDPATKKMKASDPVEEPPKAEKQASRGKSLLRKPSIRQGRVSGGANGIPVPGLKKTRTDSPEPAPESTRQPAAESTRQPAPESTRLLAPGHASKPSGLPSKLKPVGAGPAGSTSLLPNKPSQLHMASKSGLQGPKIKSAPAPKMQLRKPSGLQRPSMVQNNKGGDSTTKVGPMKAFVPAGTAVTPPNKEDKRVKAKNLSSSFSTPVKSGSTSSIESPMSSVNKRRSFLPTPNSKTRQGSSSSFTSPAGSRTSSTSSMKSVDSPLVNTSLSKTSYKSGGSRTFSKSLTNQQDRPPNLPVPPKSRRSLPTGQVKGRRSLSTPRKSSIDSIPMDTRKNEDDIKRNICDGSPSVMKSRPLVTNTPNQQKKKISPWSPVEKKKPFDLVDEAIMCTKKFRR